MTGQAVFLYDGDCAFCSSCVRFIERYIDPAARIAAWQHVDVSAFGLTPAQCDAAVQWVSVNSHVTAGPEAIAQLLKNARRAYGLWHLVGRILEWSPILWLAWHVYHWISRHRDKMPGGTPACAVPSDQRPELRPAAVLSNGPGR